MTSWGSNRSIPGMLAALSLSLSACQNNDSSVDYNSDSGELVLSPPAFVKAVRAVDAANLVAQVFVNGSAIEGNRGDDGRWRGTVNIVPPSQLRIDVRWFETINGQSLLLAEGDIEALPVTGLAPVTVSFVDRQFDTSADNDADGFSNLAERRANTDPFTDDPAVSPTRSTLSLNISLPDAIQSVPIEQIRVSAFTNGINADLVRDGSVWRGSVLETDGSRSSVVVVWDVVTTTGITLRVARSVDSITINGDTSYQPNSNTLNFQYDSDLDGESNLDEILAGTT